MLRNLLASAVILAASTSAFATISEDLKADGATSASVVTAALSACADAECKAAVLAEAVEAGIDAGSVIDIAYTAGIAPLTIMTAMDTAKVDRSVSTQFLADKGVDLTTVFEAPAAGPVDVKTSTLLSLPVAFVPDGVS